MYEKHVSERICGTCQGTKEVLTELGKAADCDNINCSNVDHKQTCPDCRYCLRCNCLVDNVALCPDKKHHRNVNERKNKDSPVMCECGVTQMYRVLEKHSIGREPGWVWVTKAMDRRQNSSDVMIPLIR